MFWTWNFLAHKAFTAVTGSWLLHPRNSVPIGIAPSVGLSRHDAPLSCIESQETLFLQTKIKKTEPNSRLPGTVTSILTLLIFLIPYCLATRFAEPQQSPGYAGRMTIAWNTKQEFSHQHCQSFKLIKICFSTSFINRNNSNSMGQHDILSTAGQTSTSIKHLLTPHT